MRVLLDGYYGMRNTGDDVFAVVATDAMHRAGATDIGLFADELPALPHEAVPVLAGASDRRGGRRVAAIAAAARRRRVIHFGGSTMRRMNTHRRDQQLLARAGLLQLHAVGLSVGPFRNRRDEEETLSFLSRFRTLAVRDAPSYERARSAGLPAVASFDPAVLLPTVPWAKSAAHACGRANRFVLGVSLCEIEEEGTERWARAVARATSLADAIAEQAPAGLLVRILEFNGHLVRGDRRISTVLADALGDRVDHALVPYSPDVRETVAAVRGCDALVGMRLHSCILAYAYAVPFGVLDYHPKCREFATTVGLRPQRIVHLDEPDVDYGPLVADVLSGDSSVACTLSLLQAQDDARQGVELLLDDLARL